MLNNHIAYSKLPPNMMEAAQLIGWAILRMLKDVPPEKRIDYIQRYAARTEGNDRFGTRPKGRKSETQRTR